MKHLREKFAATQDLLDSLCEQPETLDYHRTDTAPNKDGLVLSVRLNGQPIGSLHCVNVGGLGCRVLKWYGLNSTRTASGAAYETREEAAADVLAWHQGRTPTYVRQVVLPYAASSLPFLQACESSCQNASGKPACADCPFPGQEGGEVI